MLGKQTISLICIFSLSWPSLVHAQVKDKKSDLTFTSYLQFKERDYVELNKTRGMLDLNKPFTIEVWCRTNAKKTGPAYLIGDEAWPGMSDALPDKMLSGFVLRLDTVVEADKRELDFTISGQARGKNEWLHIVSRPQKVDDEKWHCISVSRTPDIIYIFLDGKKVKSRDVTNINMVACSSNIFLGCRKDGWKDRELNCDISSVRISNKARYEADYSPVKFIKDTNTQALYDFTGTKDDCLIDISGNERNGMISGPKSISNPK
jgi:hypothetical protein